VIVEDESFWRDLARHLCGPHPHEPPKSRREQIEEACARVRRQIEVQASSSPVRGMDDEDRRNAVVAELEDTLARLQTALKDCGPGDG
jgi:hypothetical protein